MYTVIGQPRKYNRTALTKFDYYKLLTDYYAKTDPFKLVLPSSTKEALKARCEKLNLV